MQEIFNTFGIENSLIVLSVAFIVLIILFIFLLVNNIRMNKKYKKFISKLGNSNTVEEDLKQFMERIDKVQEQNKEILNYCNNLDTRVSNCIQKIGIIRYNAYKDTGSDLSFAVALLDENNNGVVFNGIYSREMSNIYSKPIENGNSKYTLSNEELQAIDRAINSNNIYKTR